MIQKSGECRIDVIEKVNDAAKILIVPNVFNVMVLCDIEEKSYEEISEVLDLPVGTVKSRINRARNLLKDKLREYL